MTAESEAYIATMRSRSDDALAIAAPAFVASAAFSGYVGISVAAAALGILFALPAVWQAREAPLARFIAALGLMWIVSAGVLGALPSATDTTGWRDWAETEGRTLLVLGVMIAMCGLQSAAGFDRVLRRSVLIVGATSAAGVVLYLVDSGLVRRRDLLLAFTSSHHVPGFLAAPTMLVLLARPELITARWLRLATHAALFATLVLTGSRASLLALVIGAAMIEVSRRGWRQLLTPALLGLVVLAGAVGVSPRLRQTVQLVTSVEFVENASSVFRSGSSRDAHRLADSESEANVLLRFAMWGVATDRVVDSPIVGIGRFRVNDQDLTYSGVRHVAYVASGGERNHNDSQPHNAALHLLVETGVVGLAAFALPFVVVWRRSRARRCSADLADGNRLLALAAIVAVFMISMVSAGMLGTGVGLLGAILIFGADRSLAAQLADTHRAPQ